MEILIIRHGEPNYAIDSLTDKGWQEAEYLARRIAPLDVKDYYCSPLGRAHDTAKATLELAHRSAETLEWLKEFDPQIYRPDRPERKGCVWDWKPSDWTTYEPFYDEQKWYTHPLLEGANTKERYDWVTSNFDALLEKHGYKREGKYYRVIDRNHDRIVFFCHFGLECVLLSHLIGCSPMVLWHGFVAAPTSVTTIHTEERDEGIASFRISSFGDISHLYANKEEPSFAARYIECYGDKPGF